MQRLSTDFGDCPEVLCFNSAIMAFSSGPMHNLLREVSRSFYLTLRILPQSINTPLSIAYLLARATDTIADTGMVKIERRRDALLQFREMILKTCEHQQCPVPEFADLAQANDGTPAERKLLANAGSVLDCLSFLPAGDRLLIRAVLEIIIRGQEMDLIRFGATSSAQISSLQTDVELDDYTYCVAGCVGEFWTKVCRSHQLSKVRLKDDLLTANGIRFGKGLQLINILRDIPKDLRQGRCYIPAARLSDAGLQPHDLLEPSSMDRFRPLYNSYLQQAEDHLTAGWNYVGMLPFSQLRIRLACCWPILIGVKTLARLKTENVLDEQRRIKVTRPEIRNMIFRTLISYPFPSVWNRMFYLETTPQPD
jgi:farnesyl-diphosphate farnesyltransferase